MLRKLVLLAAFCCGPLCLEMTNRACYVSAMDNASVCEEKEKLYFNDNKASEPGSDDVAAVEVPQGNETDYDMSASPLSQKTISKINMEIDEETTELFESLPQEILLIVVLSMDMRTIVQLASTSKAWKERIQALGTQILQHHKQLAKSQKWRLLKKKEWLHATQYWGRDKKSADAFF